MAKPDDVINGELLNRFEEKGLDSVLRYTEKDIDGESQGKQFNIARFIRRWRNWLTTDIIRRIEQASTGITISPLDLIIQKIKEAGYSVGEVTGRKLCGSV